MKMTWQLFPSIGLVLYKVMSSLPPSSVSVERWESGGSISLITARQHMSRLPAAGYLLWLDIHQPLRC